MTALPLAVPAVSWAHCSSINMSSLRPLSLSTGSTPDAHFIFALEMASSVSLSKMLSCTLNPLIGDYLILCIVLLVWKWIL